MRLGRTRAGDSLTAAISRAIGVPIDNIVEFWLHRNPRGRTIVTVRLDVTEVPGNVITERLYELVEVDNVDHPPVVVGGGCGDDDHDNDVPKMGLFRKAAR